MEGLIFLIVAGFFGLIFILPVAAFVRAGRARRKANENENAERELTARVQALEQQVLKLTKLVARVEELEKQAAHTREPISAVVSERTAAPMRVPPAVPPEVVPPAPAAITPRVPPEILSVPALAAPLEIPTPPEVSPLKPPLSAPLHAPEEVPPARIEPPPPAQKVEEKIATPAFPSSPSLKPEGPGQPIPAPRTEGHVPPAPSRPLPTPQPVAPPRPVAHPPSFAAVRPPAPPLRERIKRLLNVEEVLGANYLGKLGVIILVIGVGGLVVYKFSSFPVWLQFLSAYLVGSAMLIAGVRFESSQYRILARAGIGGGWASIFVTTWALHHDGKTPPLSSETLDLILMLLVAVGMVVHTLKYNSQVVTGMAFLLPSLTVTVTLYFAVNVVDGVRIPSLVASAILAIGLVILVVRKHWYDLEVFGIASTFVNHFLWIRPIVERHQGFPEYYPSAALLVTYWAAFRASYIVRRVADGREESISTVAALLNTILLLAVLKYQALHPEMAFYFLLALGAAELMLGQLPISRRRRTVFIILTTLGATFLVAALPFKLSGATLPVVWLAEAEAFFLAGVFTREIVFRRLGMMAGLIVAVKMDWMALAQVTEPHFTGLQGADITKAAVVFGTTALVFYTNSHYVPRRWRGLIGTSLEDQSFRAFSYIAGSVAFLGLWLISPEAWAAVAWSGFAFAAAVLGTRLKARELSAQVPIFAGAAVLRVFDVNYASTGSIEHLSLRMVTVSLVAAFLFAVSAWLRRGELSSARVLGELHAWAASGLVAVLIWHESPDLWRAVGWAAMAFALSLLGRQLKIKEFSRQAQLLAIAGFIGCVCLDLFFTEPHHHEAPRLAAVLLAAALLYLSSSQMQLSDLPAEELLGAFHTWSASTLLVLLAWYEMRAEYAAPAWIAIGLVVAILGRSLKLKRFSFQAYALSLTAFFGALFINLGDSSFHTHITLRFGTVSFVAAMLYACSRWGNLVEFELAYFFSAAQTWAGTILLALMAWYELPEEYVAPVWCAMALILAVLDGRLKRRSLAAQGHALALAGLSAALALNFAAATTNQFNPRLLMTVGLCAAFLYLCSPWAARVEMSRKLQIHEAYAWAGSFLVSLLMWYELQPMAVAVGWALFGIVLFELGIGRRSISLRFQAYVAFCSCFARSLYVNFNPSGEYGGVSLRLWTTVFLALVFFYGFGRLMGQEESSLSRDRTVKAGQVLGYLGTITLAALMRSELDLNWVIAGWAFMVLVLVIAAWRLQFRIFLHQALLLSAAILYRAVLFNFFQSENLPLHAVHGRLVYVGSAAGLLFLSVPAALRLRAPEADPSEAVAAADAKFPGNLVNRPEQPLFFIPYLLLTIVLWLDLPNGATLSWGLEAVIIFLFALWAGQRSFRLAALALLMACVARIAVIDFWRLVGVYRWLTAMGLGVALIVVSFLYTRYHQAIRRYL